MTDANHRRLERAADAGDPAASQRLSIERARSGHALHRLRSDLPLRVRALGADGVIRRGGWTDETGGAAIPAGPVWWIQAAPPTLTALERLLDELHEHAIPGLAIEGGRHVTDAWAERLARADLRWLGLQDARRLSAPALRRLLDNEHLEGLALGPCPTWDAACSQRLAELRHLRCLNLESPGATAGLEHLAHAPSLELLGLIRLQADDADWFQACRAPKLRQLDLSGTPLPEGWSLQLPPRLERLTLVGNELHDLAFLAHLDGLHHLTLSHTRGDDDDLGRALEGLHLEALDLEGCEWASPPTLRALPDPAKLHTLRIEAAGGFSDLAAWTPPPTLRHLTLATPAVPDDWAWPPHLESLTLRDATFDPELIARLARLPNLEALRLHLGLQSGDFGVASVAPLADHPHLAELELGWGVLDHDDFQTLAKLPKLRALSFASWDVPPDAWRALAAAPHLRRLTFESLTSGGADVDGLCALARVGRLRQLTVTDLDLDAKIFAALGHCPNLTSLEVWSRCTGDDVLQLGGARRLERLALPGLRRLRDSDLTTLVQHHPRLRVLAPGGWAGVTGLGVAALERLWHLSELQLGAHAPPPADAVLRSAPQCAPYGGFMEDGPWWAR